MKTEDGNEALHPWIEPELEARLTALVLGEASDFERDELERLIAERPELGLYRKRLEVMHQMLHEVASGESGEDQGDWKLAPERRGAVLARLEGETAREEKVVVMSTPRKRSALMSRLTVAVAIVAISGLFLALLFSSLPGVQMRLERKSVESGFAYGENSEASEKYNEWYFREGAQNSTHAQTVEDERPGIIDLTASSSSAGMRSGSSPIDGGEINSELRRFQPAQNEWNHYPGQSATKADADLEATELALADQAIRPPVTTSATTAPPSEPMVVDKPGQIAALNGTAAIGAGGDIALGIDPNSPTRLSVNASGNSYTNVRVGGGFDGRVVESPPAAEMPVASALGGENTYTGGTEISVGGGALAITSPELAAGAPAAGGRELGKRGHGQVVAIDVPKSDEKPVMDNLNISESELAVREMSRNAGKADDFGAVTLGHARTANTPALAASPKPLAAAPVSGPTVADPEPRLTKLGAGTLALNGGTTALGLSDEVVEADGVIDQKQKTDAPQSAPSAGGNLNFTGDLQVNGGVEAKVNAAKKSLSLGSGGMIAGVSGQERREGFGNESPAKLDALSRSAGSGVAAGQEGDVSRMGRSVAVEKSMEESLAQGGEVVAVERKRLAENESKGEFQKNSVSVAATSSFSTSSVDVPLLGISKSVSMSVMDPMKDGPTMRMGGFEDAGSEADKSVADIMALTPQVGTTLNPEQLRQVVPRVVGGGSAPANPNVPADANGTAWYGSANSHVPAVDKIRFATFYDVGEVTDGPATSAGDSDTNHYFATASDPNGGFNVKYRPIPIDPADQTNSIYSAVLNEAPKPTPAALAETSPSAEPFSTFSLHVSDVSFQLAKAALASGKWPEAEKIRIEEFVNAFDYGDPVPSMDERVSCRIDQGAHPFLQQRNLVRIALRTAEAGRSSGTPLRLTLLLDSSGSMERPDRRATLTRAVATLAGLLGENDRITLVSFARQPRLVADAVAGNEAMKLAETVAALPSEGGTNLGAALELAFEKAREHQEANAQNRIVLLTDGAANLGDAKAESLGARVEMMREAGIAFDAAGFGAEGLNDEILEALTRKGDGRYYLLDRPEDAGEAFAEQIAGALRPAAKNVKVQVEFNPDRVKSYKLLGFEKHRLATEDFRNDAVDAAELAAAEAGVAVYQVEPDPTGEGDLGSVSVRFRDLESGEMIERRWSLPHLGSAPAPEQGGDAILLATVASQFAAKLSGGPVGDVVDLGELARLAAALPESERVKELRTMIEQARGLEGKSTNF
jgi:Mg-chelatase subunit ChlD